MNINDLKKKKKNGHVFWATSKNQSMLFVNLKEISSIFCNLFDSLFNII